MKERYVEKRFTREVLRLIGIAESICAEYDRQGFVLTLRQLYYQFVARGHIENTMQSYKRLGSIVNDARLAGLLDWEYLEDRTRNVNTVSTWSSPASIISSAHSSFKLDLWDDQPCYVEVWVEKEALVSIIETVCQPFRVPTFACRGYVSQSEMYAAAKRFPGDEKECYILHLGDHDPSGLDMTRDITDRLEMFGVTVEVKRLALNMAQVEELNPPPNPAKTTDARFNEYQLKYGDESWELDALSPNYLDRLMKGELEGLIDWGIWEDSEEREQAGKEDLSKCVIHWGKVSEFLKKVKP